MTIHVRTQIRHAIVSRLLNLPTTASRVFDTQVYPLERTHLPALTVAAEKDNALIDWSTVLISGVLVQTHALTIVIRGFAQATQQVQDVLDAMALEVTQALKADRTLGGLCKDLQVEDVPEINIAGQGEQPTGMIVLNCLVFYRIAENAPNISLP